MLEANLIDSLVVQHMMKRIQRGPVRGISLKLQVNLCTIFLFDRHGGDCSLQLKICYDCISLLNLLQEEERERRMDFVPEESAVNTEQIEVYRQPLNCLMASIVCCTN